MKTLLLALLAPERGPGTRLGALRGLIGVGKEAVRKGILNAGGEGPGCLTWSGGCGVRGSHRAAPAIRKPRSSRPWNPDDMQIVERLRDVFGDLFIERLVNDAVWARGVLAES